jgi:hypothetical protein
MSFARIDVPFTAGQVEHLVKSDFSFTSAVGVVGSLAENLIGTAVKELYVTMRAAISDPTTIYQVAVTVRLAAGAQQAGVIGVNVFTESEFELLPGGTPPAERATPSKT